jgi:hypothetical protein
MNFYVLEAVASDNHPVVPGGKILKSFDGVTTVLTTDATLSNLFQETQISDLSDTEIEQYLATAGQEASTDVPSYAPSDVPNPSPR